MKNEISHSSLLKGYLQLHDRLSDLIESGELREFKATHPRDYKWIADKLAQLAGHGHLLNVRQKETT